MKTVGKVLQRFKQIKFRYLKKFLADHLEKKSSNCIYNRNTILEKDGVSNICLCGFDFEKKEWLGGACDTRYNPELAKDCDVFEPLYSKDALKQVFNDFLETKELSHVSKHYPELAILMWVLEIDGEGEEIVSDTTEEKD